MAAVVFKTAVTRHRRVGWVRFPHAPAIAPSHHDLLRDSMTFRAHQAVLALLALGFLPLAVGAQRADSVRAGVPRSDSARVVAAPRPAPPRDPFAPPITPRRAFLYSLALPGLGQAKLQRPSAGAVYATTEMLSLVMLGKSRYDLEIAKRRVRERVVDTYQLDGNGAPTFKDGLPVVKDTLVSRYAQPRDDELRSRLKARRLHYEDWIALIAFTHLFSGADAFVSAHLWDLPKQVEIRSLPSGATGVGARIPLPRSPR